MRQRIRFLEQALGTMKEELKKLKEETKNG